MNNINVDYSKVAGVVSGLKAIADTEMDNTAKDFVKASKNMTKAKGDMYDKIKIQMNAEQEMILSMARVFNEFAASIDNAAKSFENIDTYMARKMK